MTELNSLGEVFRFVQLRPPRTSDEVPAVDLLWTELAKTLATAPTAQRRTAIADQALGDAEVTVTGPAELSLGATFVDALERVRAHSESSTGDLLTSIGEPEPIAASDEFGTDRRRLSDTILAALYGTTGAARDLTTLSDGYRVYHLIAAAAAGRAVHEPLGQYLRRTLRSPFSISAAQRPGRAPAGAPNESEESTGAADTDAARSVAERPPPPAHAIAELARLDRSSHLVQPTDAGVPGEEGEVFTLTRSARESLSAETVAVLDRYGIDLATTPIHAVIAQMEDLAGDQVPVARLGYRALAAPPPAAPLFAGDPPAVRPAGIAQLLVVKQQIKRYESGEIAHVENVLAGEKRARTHRRLERTEETFTTETETTREEEHELETAERFELNRETSRTIQQDFTVGFGLSLSGKYGPTVEFSSNAEMEFSQSVEESTTNATTYSKDVVQRSLERIAERVREERVRRIIRETEETNLHELANESSEHRNGIYQFLDKVYEAQVFDYGIREMFDFMIPEPASFLWHVDSTPRVTPRLPEPPEPLDEHARDAAQITIDNYRTIAAIYGATDVQAPPPLFQSVIGTLEHGEDDAGEGGQPRGQGKIELTVPDGYQPWRATINGLALTDHHPVIAATVGGRTLRWEPGGNDRIDLSNDFELAYRPQLAADLSTSVFDLVPESKLTVGVVAFETNTYSLNCNLLCRRTLDHLNAWKLSTFAAIHAAYQARLQEHQQLVSDLKAQAEAEARANETAARFGQPPSQNRRTIREELKKHCISLITRQFYDEFDATQDADPPFFDFDEAMIEGVFIRFFEHAFEWDQMQWVCYPYFWARKDTWLDRFTHQDVDPEFREFWMAGSARVVVPARPGFEPALNHYLETGNLWNGLGEPPVVASPLYLSIVEEIKERTGAGQGEVAVGEPWDVRVPTSLVLVRPGNDLPEWEREAPDTWEWRPVEPSDADDDGGESDDGDGGEPGDGNPP